MSSPILSLSHSHSHCNYPACCLLPACLVDVRFLYPVSQNHWNMENPLQGNGFRSMMVCDQKVDPLITEAARKANISNIAELLPPELYVWVDPFDVSCKYGEYTPPTTLYKGDNPNSAVKPQPQLQEKVSYVLTVS